MKAPAAAIAAVLVAGAAHADPLPKTGSVRHQASVVCRRAAAVDLGEVGADTAADCRGIVHAIGGDKALDNLALHCLESSVARKSGYKFMGSCVETDAAGDKLYLSYEGPESGPVTLLGGTGKFKGIAGKGEWTVAEAPGNTDDLFAFTLTYGFDWRMGAEP